jgi:hypothetical protein
MIIDKEYLTKVLPKVLEITQSESGHFLVICEQHTNGNYVDQASVPQVEMQHVFMQGLVTPELVKRLQQALEWLPLVPGIPLQVCKDIEDTIERAGKAGEK